MKKNTLAATLMAFSSLCSTAVQADNLDYDFVQLGYAAGDYADIAPFDLKGPEFEASYELSHNLFITGKYRSADDKISQYTLDETNWQALQLHNPGTPGVLTHAEHTEKHIRYVILYFLQRLRVFQKS